MLSYHPLDTEEQIIVHSHHIQCIQKHFTKISFAYHSRDPEENRLIPQHNQATESPKFGTLNGTVYN